MGIVVNVPYLKPHKKFLPHFIEWYAANKSKHDLKLHWSMWQALHKAQHLGLLLARSLKCSHILFTEDDHWGFPVDGLDVLLECDEDVIGFATYDRKPPYMPFNMRKIDHDVTLLGTHKNLIPFYQAEGPLVQDTDLLSWAFTLVKVSVFDRIQDPFAVWGKAATDSYFCQYCLDAGIQPKVHFGATIPHGDFGPEEIPARRMLEQMTRPLRQPSRLYSELMEHVNEPEELLKVTNKIPLGQG